MSKPQRSILLVDDSTEDRVAFRRYLDRSGDVTYIWYEAPTVAEALEQCRTLRPDVILVDYQLPDDNGLTLLADLIAEHGTHAFPVIMLISSGNEAIAVEAMKLGAHDYLVKDATIKDRLTLAVVRALENARLQRQIEQQQRDLEANNRQLQQALLAQQNSDMQFKGLVENAPDIIARFDHDFRFLYISPAAEQALGIAPEICIGKTKRELGMPESLCAIWETHLANVFQTGRTEEFGFVLTLSNGTSYYQATLVPELSEYGTVETVMSIARNVTAFKVLEARLRFLSDASTALGSSLDYQATLNHVARLIIPYLADACIIDLVDQQAIRAAVVAHSDLDREATLREMRRCYPPLLKSKHPVVQVLQTQRPMIVYEIPQPLISDQSYDAHHQALLGELDLTSFLMVPFVVRGQPIGVLSLYATGQPRSYTIDDLGLVEELVRRAALALDNAQLYQEAQEAIRERDAFISIASHEIKNPLTSLSGRAQMLQRRFATLADNERTQRDIDTILEQANRINALLSSMLDASRLTNDQFTIERTSVNLSALLQLVIAGFQPATSTHQITLVNHDPPPIVDGDAGRLEQVFYNLINNAIKYSPAGGAIEIVLDRHNESTRVAISDKGLGIPAEALPNLFKRFYRIPRSTAQISGSGIGLYVVKEIVTSHGGTIEVTSTESVGSTFTVLLPLLPEEAEDGGEG